MSTLQRVGPRASEFGIRIFFGRRVWPRWIQVACLLALLIFGSGPVRGFAVVHCLGIMTSMFSAVFVSRGIVALIYGGRKHLTGISIGQVWRPATGAGVPAK